MENLDQEKSIIQSIITDSREELISLLDSYLENINEFDVKNKTADDIIEYFVRIIFKLNRFNEFKSKFKVLERGNRISKKELERCDFVIKINGNKSLSIVKNTINDVKGVFVKN